MFAEIILVEELVTGRAMHDAFRGVANGESGDGHVARKSGDVK